MSNFMDKMIIYYIYLIICMVILFFASLEKCRCVNEGADFIMVKPGGQYLDIVSACKARCDVPIAVYQVRFFVIINPSIFINLCI